MHGKVSLDAIYAHSEDVVTRVIEGELLLIPIVSGVGDLDDELFTFSETGRSIWEKLCGRRSLAQVAGLLKGEYEAAPGEIEEHVLGFTGELLRRRMIVTVPCP